MRPVRFRLEAAFDIEAALAWYERRSPRLGLRFLTAVAATLDAIEIVACFHVRRDPSSWSTR